MKTPITLEEFCARYWSLPPCDHEPRPPFVNDAEPWTDEWLAAERIYHATPEFRAFMEAMKRCRRCRGIELLTWRNPPKLAEGMMASGVLRALARNDKMDGSLEPWELEHYREMGKKKAQWYAENRARIRALAPQQAPHRGPQWLGDEWMERVGA